MKDVCRAGVIFELYDRSCYAKLKTRFRSEERAMKAKAKIKLGMSNNYIEFAVNSSKLLAGVG
jgi:hypothetical protein